MQHYSDSGIREPEIKYIVEDLCETFQEGVAICDNRVRRLVVGKDVKLPEELRKSFDTGDKELGRAYLRYYKQAGKHFAYGDADIQSQLAHQLHILTIQVIEILHHSSDDAISGIPSLPGSYHRYTVVNYAGLYRKSESVRKICLNSLEVLFSKISEWAVPLHTLPPLASPPTTSTISSSEGEREAAGFVNKIKAPFRRLRYEYEELPSQLSFRLIKIHTARPYVTCEMETFHLSDPPKFQALSYCWGKYGQNSDIWCNNSLLKVSSNLKKGLQRLHKYSAWSRTKWFWIDQISINQNDFTERNQQIRLMRAIYQQAQNTVIWLGSDDGNAGPALSLAGDLYELSLSVEPKEQAKKEQEEALVRDIAPSSSASTGLPQLSEGSSPVSAPGMPSLSRSLKIEDLALPSKEDKRWKALPSFLGLPWFERCWIIQEVVVSKGDPVMLCGGHQFLWSRFHKAMAWLIQFDAKYRTDRMKLINGIADLSSTRDVWELQGLLHLTRPFLASDPRDKIFALLGLAGETTNPDSWPRQLAPNYTRSTRDVYMEVTLYCIRKTKSLSILAQVDRSLESSNLLEGLEFPSWVPRWDLPQLTCGISAFSVSQNRTGWKLLVEKFNHASMDLEISLDPYTAPGILRLEGLLVTTVQSCLPTMFPDQSPDSSSKSVNSQLHPKFIKSIPELFNICRSRIGHLTHDQFSRSFFHVTTAGLTPEQGDARREPMVHFRAFLPAAAPMTPGSEHGNDHTYSLRNALQSNLSVSTLSPSITPPASTDSINSPYSLSRSTTSQFHTHSFTSSFGEGRPDPTRYTAALGPLLHRRLFITAFGHLGLGPAGMMSGDAVVVLFGGKVPFVLRHVVGDKWRLIGECFVDGFMQGEALDPAMRPREERLDTEWFELI